ncbi:hypothetical protein GCM10010517_64690 [Streptosporangium fragile]|uniref:STAS domain-containing protein n=2 Tax=Streptosporangium fragile TaxID=46186 RepID=A0ABP6IMH3_9ACTN
MKTGERGCSGRPAGGNGDPFPLPGPLRATTRVRPDGMTVISVRGELDLATAEPLCELVGTVLERSGPRAVLDLSGVTFCDMSGLRALQHCAEDARASEGVLLLTGLSDRLLWLLGISGVRYVSRGGSEYELTGYAP